MPPTPPPSVLDEVGPHPWVALEPTNPTGSKVWRVGEHHVKFQPATMPGPSVVDEAQRLDWLRPHLPAPDVRAVIEDEVGGWLVTATVVGTPAHRAELHPDVEDLVTGVADALRRLHAIPVDSCPFDAGWERLDAEVQAALAGGWIDPSAMAEPFARYDAQRLVELWRQGRPERQDPVVLHGDASLPNLLLDGDTVTGVVDVGRLGVGDRHLDLAVAQESILRNLGPHALFAFYDAYGTDPDLVRLEHYRLGALIR